MLRHRCQPASVVGMGAPVPAHSGNKPPVFSAKPTSPCSTEIAGGSAMGGLGYGARIKRIKRGVVSSRLTGVPSVSSPLCVECALAPLKGASAPRASWRVIGLYGFESIA